MAFSDFTLRSVREAFGLRLRDEEDLFEGLPETEVGSFLRSILDETAPLAIAIHTEKARSELIVSPVLVEVRRRLEHRVSLFSGIDFSVAPERGLNGICDFLISDSRLQSLLETPVMAVVEAKRDDISAGLGQCAAEMVAARLFNEREGRPPKAIHGLVTTGSLWRFLRLDGDDLAVDGQEYPLDRLGKILAILIHSVGGFETAPGATT